MCLYLALDIIKACNNQTRPPDKHMIGPRNKGPLGMEQSTGRGIMGNMSGEQAAIKC